MFSRSDRKINPPVAGVHGGQAQGGISTPANSPYVFLFTSVAGASYGYYDSFRPDGSFWYTGEGQVGDMELVRGNAAIAEHHANKKRLLLFEYVKKGIVRFLGEVEYLGDHKEERLDRNGNNRKAIIFHLGFLPPARKVRIEQPKASYLRPASLPKDLPLDQLRQIALEGVAPKALFNKRGLMLLGERRQSDDMLSHAQRVSAKAVFYLPRSAPRRDLILKSTTYFVLATVGLTILLP